MTNRYSARARDATYFDALGGGTDNSTSDRQDGTCRLHPLGLFVNAREVMLVARRDPLGYPEADARWPWPRP
jgi:hypothetical protein